MFSTSGTAAPARGNGGGGGGRSSRAAKAKSAKQPKLLDVSLTRIQFTGKLASTRQFCTQSLKDALEKAKEFESTQPGLFQMWHDLVRKGVGEDKVLDQSLNLGLGDNAGIVKCLYHMEARRTACLAASGLLPENQMLQLVPDLPDLIVGETGSTEGNLEARKAERLQMVLDKIKETDTVVNQYASPLAEFHCACFSLLTANATAHAVATTNHRPPECSCFCSLKRGKAVVVQMLERTDLFDECHTRDAFTDKLKEIKDRATDTKTIAQSLRKCVTEVGGLVQAVSNLHF